MRQTAGLLIALSGYGQDRDRSASLEAGFLAHVTKPVDASELLSYIESLLLTPRHRERAAKRR